MLPSFISEDAGKQILLIGKSIVFLRQCCGTCLAQTTLDLPKTTFCYGADAPLRSTLKDVAARTSKMLADVICGATSVGKGAEQNGHQFNLLKHCFALHRYLFLAQGDFIQSLIELLWEPLSHLPNTVYHHTLVEALETAIRTSSAQFDCDDVKGRLDVLLNPV